ncbi:MAG: hypothetical protein IJ375_00405, partial [Oscillospiraceae bacterium]|nr:hypothetical protein [Oscillospiraceae bacterium]
CAAEVWNNHQHFGEFVLQRSNPSVKNRRFLTAPFTQGSLGALPRQCDKLQFTTPGMIKRRTAFAVRR